MSVLAFNRGNYQVTLSPAPEAHVITDQYLSQLRAIVGHHGGRNLLETSDIDADLLADASGVARAFRFQGTGFALEHFFESLACLPCNVTCTTVEP